MKKEITRILKGPEISQKRKKSGFIFLVLLASLFLNFSNPLTNLQTIKQSGKYVLSPFRQYQLFQKILTFERTWKKKLSSQLTIALLYEKNYELSVWTKDDFAEAVKAEAMIEEYPVRLLEITVDDMDKLPSLFSQGNIAFLYLAPLKPLTVKNQLKKILTLCRQFKIPTFTGEIEYVELGVAIGLGVVEEKPQVFINLQAAREQGLNFSSQLLRMSSVR